MRAFVLALATCLPLVGAAQPASKPAPPATAEEHTERRLRMMRVVSIAEELNLDPSQALKIDEAMRKYDERRRPLREQVAESIRIVQAAAAGDAAAGRQVDQAIDRILRAREQLAAIDREMFTEVARNLPPQQRAKLAILMAKLHAHAHEGLERPPNDDGSGFRGMHRFRGHDAPGSDD